jgi:hypothetical protein
MKSHDGERIEAALSGSISESVLLAAKFPIEQNRVLFASCTYNEYIIVSDHGLRATSCMVPKVDSFVVAVSSWTRAI